MDFNFNKLNNRQQEHEQEQDECFSKGICSVSPTLASVQAVILVYLEELAFYLLELDVLGIHNEKIKNDVIEAFSELVENVEFRQENLNELTIMLYENLYQAKEVYSSFCQKNNIEPFYLKSPIKISKKVKISEAIRQGQKYFVKKEKMLSEEQKQNFEILLIILKSMCINMVELTGLGVNVDIAYKEFLSALSLMNFSKISNQNSDEIIEKFAKIDNELILQVYDARKNAFGEIKPTVVSTSTRIGKAILVSGRNLKELEHVLEATKGRDIDVYTHGRLKVAHAYSKFQSYPNLVGHFGKGSEAGIVDFAAFPGAIFLTKLSLQGVERLYRSRIYTTDIVAPLGVISIKNGDYEPLIQSAVSSKGFVCPNEREPFKVGFYENELFGKLKEVEEKLENNEIKHFFLIGISNETNTQKEYFEQFLETLPDDCFVLSFSYTDEEKNVLQISMDTAFVILHKTIEILSKNNEISDLKMSILYTNCNYNSISNLINTKTIGIKDIYFPKCSPSLINPKFVEEIKDKYGIKTYTNPRADIQKMLLR